ncbi:uncharacterized protein EV420DRAFT_1476517 [Desarmillaria tabescens]|uniref:Uncharacterized protein n=1 Tax=Armillaria tabescens TaxID=1929756 RepID=A0AA39NE89_ARMTA|nr:uncharacterized protein EV420DRAFT_1476517 [Desarmillaria tabescens]KAK0463868.1 hypothetical protein EV420DRAFT_1476517 [Desarmillaria tabescens]
MSMGHEDPHPVHPQLGHKNYITLDLSFKHGPYIPNYSPKPLPHTATDLHILHSSILSSPIQEYLNSPIAKSPPPSDFQNTWHLTAIRYRDTSAYDVVSALCMLWRFEAFSGLVSGWQMSRYPRDSNTDNPMKMYSVQWRQTIEANRGFSIFYSGSCRCHLFEGFLCNELQQLA